MMITKNYHWSLCYIHHSHFHPKMKKRIFKNFLILPLSFLVLQLSSSSSSPDSNCLDKLCQIESGCNPKEKCLGSGTAHCGPYHLSNLYWKSSGKPGKDFESCVFDIDCARQSVNDYLKKYSRDCDGDGQITCLDYIAIQKAGPSNCHEGWVFESNFFKRFMALEGFALESDPVPDESFFNETRLTTNSLEVRVRDRNPRRDERFRPTRNPRRPYTIVYWPVDDPRLVTEAPRRTNRRPWIISVGDRSTPRPARTTATVLSVETVPTRRRRTRTTTIRPTRPMSTRRSRTTERPRSSTSIWSTRSVTIPSVTSTVNYAPTSTTPRSTTARTASTARPSTTISTTTSRPVVTSISDVAPRIAPTASPTSTTTRSSRTKPTFNPTRTPKSTTTAPPTDWTFGLETDPTTPRKPVTSARAPNETKEVVPFKESCLECICLGSSGCNYQTKCEKDGECGPYKIDYAYWYEAGYPGYEGEEDDFKKCVQIKECAETTVKQYVARYTKDCNDDGIIDCIDYAALHKSGPGECSKQWVYESKFWATFSDCHGFDFRRRR